MATSKRPIDSYMETTMVKKLDRLAGKELMSRSAFIRKTLIVSLNLSN